MITHAIKYVPRGHIYDKVILCNDEIVTRTGIKSKNESYMENNQNVYL